MFDKLKKAIGIKGKKRARSPTLDTILMVEEFIKENSGRCKKTEVFNNLPRKVMWQTFQVIVDYLISSMKISANEEGYLDYIWNKFSLKTEERSLEETKI